MLKVSDSIAQSARKNEAAILCALGHITQKRVAELIGVHESTVSTMKDGRIQDIASLLSALNLRVVTEDAVLMDPKELESITYLAHKQLAGKLMA